MGPSMCTVYCLLLPSYELSTGDRVPDNKLSPIAIVSPISDPRMIRPGNSQRPLIDRNQLRIVNPTKRRQTVGVLQKQPFLIKIRLVLVFHKGVMIVTNDNI